MKSQIFQLIIRLIIIPLIIIVERIESKTVTFDKFGTFNSNDFIDLRHRPISLLPENPAFYEVKFSLFTRANRNLPEIYLYNSTLLKNSKFERRNELKMILHGFHEDAREWMYKVKDSYLKSQDLNVILVEYPEVVQPPYLQAVANARIIGLMVGQFIKALIPSESSLNKVHVIGHSLGSHIAGYAGKYLNGKLGRITALDPAGPLFEGLVNRKARLWYTDARFVDSIHTNRGHDKLPFTSFGMYETCSHVSIFVNGGERQPGCPREQLNALIFEQGANRTRRVVFCSHIRSVEYFTESIMGQELIAKPLAYRCKDWQQFLSGKCDYNCTSPDQCVELGPNAIQAQRIQDQLIGQRFFMATDSRPKFFKYQYLLTIFVASNVDNRPQMGKIEFILISAQTNQKQSMKFNDDSEKFQPGQNYSRVFVSKMPWKMIDTIELEWKTSKPLKNKRSTLVIDRIELLPLSEYEKTTSVFRNRNTGQILTGKALKFPRI